MKTKALLSKNLLILIFLQMITFGAISRDAPITFVSGASACPGAELALPVTVNSFSSVSSITLRLDYNPQLMVYNAHSNVNTLLPGILIVDNTVTPTLHKIIIVWSNVNPVTLSDGAKLLDLHFTYLSAEATLSFNNTSNGGGDCEYSDENGDPMNDMPTISFYSDAQITNLAVGSVGNISGPSTVSQGQSGVEYSVTPVINATGYNWSLPDGAIISSGINTNSILVDFSASAITGEIIVQPFNACGYGEFSVPFPVNINSDPVINVIPASLNFGDVLAGTHSGIQTYTITGYNLIAPVIVSAPSGFAIYYYDWIQTLELPHTEGSLNATISVCFKPSDATAYSLSITNESTGATTQNVSVTGTGIENNNPYIVVEPEALLIDIYNDFIIECPPATSYNIVGYNLTENVFIGSDWAEVCLTAEGDFTEVLDLAPINGVVDTTVYVRLCYIDYNVYYTFVGNSSSGVGVTMLVHPIPIAGNAPITTIGQVTAQPGTLVNVPVTVTDFINMNRVNYVIEFDPNILSFQYLEDSYNNFLDWSWYSVVQVNPILSQLIITTVYPHDWCVTYPDGVLFDMVFFYNGGTSSLNFGNCSFYNLWTGLLNDEPDSLYYDNGSVSQADTLPSITISPATLSFGDVLVGTHSAVQSYTLTGSNLTAPVTVTAPSGYSIYGVSYGSWVKTLTLSPDSGNLNATIDIRFNPIDSTEYTGIITNESTGASIQAVAVTGTGIENDNPYIYIEPETLIIYHDFLSYCTPALPYRIYGNNLTENIDIAVDWYFGPGEMSFTGEDYSFASSLELTPLNGFVDTTVFVRLCPGEPWHTRVPILNSSSGVLEHLFVIAKSTIENAPVTTIGNIIAQPATLVSVPLYVTNFFDINQAQYSIQFDPNVLTFQEVIYEMIVNSWLEISVTEIDENLSQLNILLQCASDAKLTMPDNSKLFDLVFSYSSGTSALTFGDCSFIYYWGDYWGGGLNDEPDSLYYHNGSVSDQPTIIVSVDTVYFDDILMYNWSPPSKYSVSGFNLNSDLVITTTSNANCYKLSRQSESGYSDSVSLPQSNGIVESTEIFIKQNACLECFEPAYIIHSSAGAASNEIRIINRPDGPHTQEAPKVYLGNEGALPGSPVVVPVIVENFQYLSTIFLTIEYNPTVISFEDYTGYLGDVTVNEITVSPDTARLQIYIMRSTSDVTLNLPDFSKLIEIEFNYLSGATDLVFIPESYFLNHQEQELDDEPYPEHYFNGSVGPFTKNINLTICLEGLYNEAAGFMNKAQYESGNMFPGTIADRITVKLAKSTFPYNFISVYENLELNQDKTCTLQLPANMDDEYYLVINHRNSLETWSANPVAFGSDNVYYNFTQDPQYSYGGNVKLLENSWCIYGGDVNQDDVIDTGDMTPVDNDASVFATGYLSTDVNGDGVIDTGDMTIVDNNTSSFIGALYPLVPPTAVVETTQITPLSGSSVNCSGNVTYQGSTMVTQRGVCWSTSPEPDFYDNHASSGIGLGAYNCQINGLTPNTYYFRAYAYNGTGFSYGNELSCIIPFFTNGEGVNDFDGNSYTSVIIGTQEWMAENLKVTHYRNGDAIPNVTGDTQWEGLTTGAYCWYNNDISWKDAYGALYNWYAVVDSRVLCPIGWHTPTDAEWTILTDYLGGSSIAGGKMKSTRTEPESHPRWNSPNTGATNESSFSGLPGDYRDRFGTFGSIGSYGIFWSSSENSSYKAYNRLLYDFTSRVSGNTGYKRDGYSVRCLRDEISIVSITTMQVTEITSTTAMCGGEITDNGVAEVTARGVCWSTSLNPDITDEHTSDGSGTGSFTSLITGLSPGTLYHVRAYATNSTGTAYGEDRSFITQSGGGTGTVTDIDGNVYQTIQIGTQEWMAENLIVTHYRNGDSIPNIVDDSWSNLISGAYCWYNNDEATYKNTYGALYNWYTVVDNRELCPAGWHIPDYEDWTTLADFLGGVDIAGGKMKSTRTAPEPHPRFDLPNAGATNISGFTGFPGGYRLHNGVFEEIGRSGYWWNSTVDSSDNTWMRAVDYNGDDLYSDEAFRQTGFSVRCIKD